MGRGDARRGAHRAAPPDWPRRSSCAGPGSTSCPIEALERKALSGYLATNRALQPEMIGAPRPARDARPGRAAGGCVAGARPPRCARRRVPVLRGARRRRPAARQGLARARRRAPRRGSDPQWGRASSRCRVGVPTSTVGSSPRWTDASGWCGTPRDPIAVREFGPLDASGSTSRCSHHDRGRCPERRAASRSSTAPGGAVARAALRGGAHRTGGGRDGRDVRWCRSTTTRPRATWPTRNAGRNGVHAAVVRANVAALPPRRRQRARARRPALRPVGRDDAASRGPGARHRRR